ncbi:MAG: hypothetical protein WBC04_02065 [Candidatus Acidiferrales bacterium]
MRHSATIAPATARSYCNRFQLREVLAYQEALGQEDVTTLGDLDNVIWEIANEAQAQPGADQWQEEMIRYIRGLESGKLRHHLIWRTTEIAGCNQSLTTTDGTVITSTCTIRSGFGKTF